MVSGPGNEEQAEACEENEDPDRPGERGAVPPGKSQNLRRGEASGFRPVIPGYFRLTQAVGQLDFPVTEGDGMADLEKIRSEINDADRGRIFARFVDRLGGKQ